MKIARQEVVVSFKVEPTIVLTCGTSLKKIQEKLGGKILSINAPEDSPPSLPRVILKLADTILNVALDRFQITTIPPSHIANDIKKSSKFAFQRSVSILSELLTSMPDYLWAGAILDIEFPEDPLRSDSAIEAAIPIFDRLIKIDRKTRELSSFQLQFGFKDDPYFINYTISAFESRKIEFKAPPKSGPVILNPSDFPLSECGIKVLLDINNKPNKPNEKPLEDLEGIFSNKKMSFDSLVEDLKLKGLV